MILPYTILCNYIRLLEEYYKEREYLNKNDLSTLPCYIYDNLFSKLELPSNISTLFEVNGKEIYHIPSLFRQEVLTDISSNMDIINKVIHFNFIEKEQNDLNHSNEKYENIDFNQLPFIVIHSIFEYLNVKDVCNFSLVSHKMYEISNNNALWKILSFNEWSNKCKRKSNRIQCNHLIQNHNWKILFKCRYYQRRKCKNKNLIIRNKNNKNKKYKLCPVCYCCSIISIKIIIIFIFIAKDKMEKHLLEKHSESTFTCPISSIDILLILFSHRMS